jgi:hypothetical protein
MKPTYEIEINVRRSDREGTSLKMTFEEIPYDDAHAEGYAMWAAIKFFDNCVGEPKQETHA